MVFSSFSAALSSSKISGPSMFVLERSRISRFEFPRIISLMNGTKISSDEKLIRCVETESSLRGHFWLFFLKKFRKPARASIPLTSRNFKLGRFSTGPKKLKNKILGRVYLTLKLFNPKIN